MSIRYLAATLAFLAAANGAQAQELNQAEAACAAEAASPFEAGLGTVGKPIQDIDAQRAVDLCWVAMGTGSNDYRLNAWMARAFYSVGQFEDAAYFADRAAAEGVPLGQYVAGILYSNGDGVAADAEKGAQLLVAAAEAGFVPAYQGLAISLLNGVGVAQDPSLAVEFLQFAADEGFGPAATTLGQLYAEGLGVQQSDAESARLYRLAVHLGDPEGMFELGRYAEAGIAQPADEAKAADLYWSAIEHGSTAPLMNLAMLYLDGRGVDEDQDLAAELIARAAALGDSAALELVEKLTAP